MELKKGNYYLWHNEIFVRLIQDLNFRDVTYRDFLFESGEPLTGTIGTCSIVHFKRNILRELTEEEASRMQDFKSLKEVANNINQLKQRIVEAIETDYLIDELERRGFSVKEIE